MELDSSSDNAIVNPRIELLLNEQDDAEDSSCCPSFREKSCADDSEDEKESWSGSISSDSSSEASDISTTDSSSDPSSLVTCIPQVGRCPAAIDAPPFLIAQVTKEESGSSHMDRKRKEHDEPPFFQEQDTKLIRSLEPDDRSDKDSRMEISGVGVHPGINEISSDVNSVAVSGSTDDNNFGFGSLSETEFDYGIRSVPTSIEPEIQRQWERTAAQWHSRKFSRSHRPRHYARTSTSFSEVEEVIRTNACNMDELKTHSKSFSASIPISHPSQVHESFDNAAEDDRNTKSTVLEPLPQLDLSTLHHQIESEEPISLKGLSSSDQVMLSPRNSVAVIEDVAIPPSPPTNQLPMDPPLSRQILEGNQESEIHSLSRQVLNWKKQLKALEKEHVQVFGYKPSHADRTNHREMRKCVIHINKAKQELKQIRENPSAISGQILMTGLSQFNRPMSLKDLETTVTEVETILAEDRKVQGRPEDPILMNSAEIICEKGIMQKYLLLLEKRHGRPSKKEEKDVVRNLYDRYRTIKKISSRFTTVKENSLDLVPILEHETLDLQPENSAESSRIGEVLQTKKSPRASRRRLIGITAEVPTTYIETNQKVKAYNDMELKELEHHYKITSEEKRRLRSALRAIEPQSQGTPSGQKRDDKYSTVESEMMHQKYKHTRATLRLLDVLINKRKYTKMVQDRSLEL